MATLDSSTVDEMRARLASRPSFFGGTVSTRLQSAVPGWKEATRKAPAPAAPSRGTLQQAGTSSGESTASRVQLRKAVAGSGQPDRQQQRQRMARDFSSMDDDDAAGAPPGSAQSMPKTGERALAAVAAIEKLRAKAGPSRTSTPPPRAAAGFTLDLLPASATTPSEPVHARKTATRVVLPKGKKGAAARSLAVAPQGQGGLTGRQAADQLMQQKLAELRSRRMAQLRQDQRSKRPREPDEEDADSLEDSDYDGDWRAELRRITTYDPSKYGQERDDRSMVASRAQIEAEERRSARMGRQEDERDAEEEARARAAKAAKKEWARKRGRTAAERFLA